VTNAGKRKLLLVNKRNRDFEASVPGASGGLAESVDVTTGFRPASRTRMSSDRLTVHGFSVTVITLP
jgi:hypothetical protein